MIKKILIVLTVVLNLILPLNVFGETTTENISQTVEIEEKSDSSFGFIEILAFIGFIVLIIYLLFNKIKGKSKKHTFDDEDDDEETENNNNDDTINNNTENESQIITGLINKDID